MTEPVDDGPVTWADLFTFLLPTIMVVAIFLLVTTVAKGPRLE